MAKKKSPERNQSQTKLSIFQKLENAYLCFSPGAKPPMNFGALDFLLLTLCTVISFGTQFCMLGKPNSVVFDEVYFGNFTNNYVNHEYFFDIHPPLGKELIYFGSKLMGYDGNLIFGHISQEFESKDIKKLRAWPCLFAAMRSPVLFMTLRFCDVGLVWSFTVATLASLDNALIVESRFVLIDAFLSFFSALTTMFAAYLARHPTHPILAAALAGMAAGATVSVKFTGGGTALALVICIFVNYPFSSAFSLSAIATMSAFFVFFSSFFIHFSILTKPGPGCKFHPYWFCENLRKGVKMSKLKSMLDLIDIMLRSNLAIQEGHFYSSKWYQWPLMIGKGTYLWVKDNAQIWCVGSPIVWYFGLLGIACWLIQFVRSPKVRSTIWIALGYCISYLPFSTIKRVMWNYHYFIPLLYSLLCGGIALDSMKIKFKIIPSLLLFAAVAAYIVYFPITYGTSISQSQFHQIMFKSWTY